MVGAGGAGRALAFGALERGAAGVLVCNRRVCFRAMDFLHLLGIVLVEIFLHLGICLA